MTGLVHNVFSPSIIQYTDNVPMVNFSNVVAGIREIDISLRRPNVSELKVRKDTQQLLDSLSDLYGVNPEILIEYVKINRHLSHIRCEVTLAIHFLALTYPEIRNHVFTRYTESMMEATKDRSYLLWEPLNKLNKMGKPFNQALSMKVVSLLEKKVVPDKGFMYLFTVEEVTRINTGIAVIKNMLLLGMVQKNVIWEDFVNLLDI